MKILGVIPARYKSTRLEGKPLKLISGYTMIEWVYKRAKATQLDEVVVATDNELIYNEVVKFGGNVIMTSESHDNGTDRIIEVMDNEKYKDYEFIINIQGDEPLIDADSINKIISNYKEQKSNIITLKKEIKNQIDFENPNVVKVITDFNGDAIYFSRSLIPFFRNENNSFKNYKHIGIYGYTREFLINLKNLKVGFLEKIESLEQLRFMENGFKIKVLETTSNVFGVDTQEDLEFVREYIEKNNISIF